MSPTASGSNNIPTIIARDAPAATGPECEDPDTLEPGAPLMALVEAKQKFGK